jgi:hypothetical protein
MFALTAKCFALIVFAVLCNVTGLSDKYVAVAKVGAYSHLHCSDLT